MKLEMMRGAGWLAASRLLINGIGLASTIILARLLSPDDFGIVALALTFIAIIGSVTEIPLSAALIQLEAPEQAHFDSAWTLSVLRGTILAIVLAIAAIPLGDIYGDQRLIPLMFVLAILTFVQSLASPMVALFTRRLVFKQEFVIGVAKKLGGFVFALLFALIYHTYWALIVGQAASEIITVAVTYFIAPYRPRFTLSRGRELISFSIWLSLVQAVQALNYRLDNLFIGYYLTSADVGQYSYGTNLALIPTRESTAPIAQTLFPAFTKVRSEPEKLVHVYVRAQTLLCAIALPIGIGFAAIASPMVYILLGDKWAPAILAIQVLSSVFALQTLASTLHPLAMAMGETRSLFRRDVANLIVRFPLILVGLFLGGFAGMIYARIFSGLASICMNMALVRRFIGLSVARQFIANKRGLVASGIMAAAIVLFQKLVPIPPGIAAGCVFLGVQVALGACIYVLVCCAIWAVEGRPSGPEAEGIALARATMKRLSTAKNPQ